MLVVVSRSDVLIDPQLSAWVRAAFVLANVAGGAYTWWRRPASGFGPLLAGAGLLFALTSLNALAQPLPFTLGRVAYAAVMFALAYVCLCFPRGRLGSRRDRLFIGALAVVTTAVWVLVLLFAVHLPAAGPFAACAATCPANALQLFSGAEATGRVLGDLANAVTVASFVAVTGLLLVRMRESDPRFRRTLTPLFAALAAVLASLAAFTIARAVSDSRPPVASAAV